MSLPDSTALHEHLTVLSSSSFPCETPLAKFVENYQRRLPLGSSQAHLVNLALFKVVILGSNQV